MTLHKGYGKKTIGENIAIEEHHHKPKRQAVAIALSVARKAKEMHEHHKKAEHHHKKLKHHAEKVEHHHHKMKELSQHMAKNPYPSQHHKLEKASSYGKKGHHLKGEHHKSSHHKKMHHHK